MSTTYGKIGDCEQSIEVKYSGFMDFVAMVLIRAEQKPRDVRGARNFNRFLEYSSQLYLSFFTFRVFREYTRIRISVERISDVRPSAFTYLPLQVLFFPINSVLLKCFGCNNAVPRVYHLFTIF